jgi:hypothetical protein
MAKIYTSLPKRPSAEIPPILYGDGNNNYCGAGDPSQWEKYPVDFDFEIVDNLPD